MSIKSMLFITVLLTVLYTCTSNDVTTNVSSEYTDNIFFLLYSGPRVTDYVRIPFKDGYTFQNYSSFNVSFQTIFYYPGWGEVATAAESVNVIAAAYLTRKNETNLIVIDYSSLVTFYDYPSAIANGTKIGEALASYFNGYIPCIQPKELLHHIGHSLGGQIMSDTAKSYMLYGQGKLYYLTGLDPAGPGYEFIPGQHHLDASDAEFVDVIHTNGGEFGFLYPVGTVDFFPNGGSIQPYCVARPTDDFRCNHWMSWRYYAESIMNPFGFLSKECSSTCQINLLLFTCLCNNTQAYMGYGVSKTSRGNFYLQTNVNPSFAKGTAGINFGINTPLIGKQYKLIS